MIEIQPPNRYPAGTMRHRVFLAGSIEMGIAEQWQKRVVKALESYENVVIYNPRRDDWDNTWEQTINCPQFYEQVTWELDMIEDAHYVLFYFDPNTKSPITLAELGLCLGLDKNHIYVVCPPDFYRRGNVEIMCDRYGHQMYSTLDDAINEIKRFF